jgi:cell division protein FtsZ
MLQFADDVLGPKIKVIGVGGGGGNSVNTMIEAGIQGVDFVAANTDSQVLQTNMAPMKLQIGKNLTKGLGAGANPEIGAAAAIEDAGRLAEFIAGADMVFVTAGMGGGTGTGAAPVIAQVARDMGALTVGVVTKPFAFEGLQRKKKANSGITELAKAVDALIVIPNDRLVALAGQKMTLRESFSMVDTVCLNAVRGISDLIMVPGLINVDFADVRTIMTGMGRALMGTGMGQGERRAVEAAQMAINSPLLEDVSINGATGILVNITGGADLTLSEVNEACSLIQEAADPDANIIFGSVIDPTCNDEVRITVIATGFQGRAEATAPSRGGRTPEIMSAPAPIAVSAAASAPSLITAPTGLVPPSPFAPAASAPMVATAQMGGHGMMDPHEALAYGTDATEPYPAVAPYAAYSTSPYAPAADWSSPKEVPTIRPPVPANPALAGGARRSQGGAAPFSGENLGIEDSEYDSPAYLRRARVQD